MKKILFSLFAIFSLFLLNDNVFAASLQDDLYLSQEYYYQLSDYIIENFGTGLSGVNGERCAQILLTRVFYHEDYIQKTYYILQYEKIIDSFLWSDNFDTWGIYAENYVEITIDEYYEDGILIDRGYSEHINEGKGYAFSNQFKLKYLDNYSTSWGAYHFALSYDAITIYTTSDFNEKYLFYNPGYNFEKNITGDTLKTNPDQSYDDYYSDIEEPNQNIFERIWGGIINIFNSIISLPEKIGQAFQNVFSFVFPDREYFETQIAVLDKLFNEELGFLYESFDFMFDIINRFLNIGNGSKVITIPTIIEPISNHVIIEGTTFNFDDVLNSSNIKTLHTLYLAFVDVIVFIGLINLGRKQFDKVVGGHL